jgi:CHAT domain-containing protein/tetratricopeptide (TPR) repeat protein
MRNVLAVVVCALAVASAAPKPKTPPPKTPATTPDLAHIKELQAIDQQMYALQAKQAYLAAAKLARKTYELEKKASGEDSKETQRRKQTLASMLQLAGDYSESLKLDKEVLATAERLYGPESREVLYAISPIMGPLWQQNRLDELDPLYQRMLALTKKLDGENSQMYALALMQYGTMLNQRNEYSSAQRLYEQSLKVHEAVAKTKDDISLLSPIQLLANLYWQTNQRQKATAMFDRAIALAQKAPNGNVSSTAATMWSVASVYHYGGRDDLAAPIQKKVIELYTNEIARLEKDKPDDIMIGIFYGQLGYIERMAGHLDAAEKSLTKAIELDEKRTGYSAWQTSLADIKRAQGKPREALAILEKSQAGLTKIAPKSATAFNSMIADVLRELGEYKRAEALLEAYRKDIEKTYGKKSPIYGMAELSTAYVYMGAGKVGEAERLLTDSLELAERELSNVLKSGTEADHAVYFARNSYQLDTAINFHLTYAPRSPSAARLALTTLVRRKGRVLDAAAASLATIRAKLSPDDKKLLDDLASARAKLAKLTVAGATTGDADYAKEVAALEDQIQKLELAVGKKSAAYRTVSQAVELKAIQKAIPKDAKLVEMVNFQPSDPKAPFTLINPKLPPRHYAAYVVGNTGDPSVVDLGEVGPIDEAIEKFRKAVADPDNDRAAELGHTLYALTFGKVKAALGTSTNVLIAPDGTLNVVPFSALVDDKQQFLIKTYTFTYLTSGRDLLRVALRSKAQGGGVIFADPSFDSTGKAAAAGGGTRGRRSSELSTLSWPPLPGTGQEADLVEKTMRGLKVFRGADATEGAVKQLRGPKILHLATHGFFLPDEAPPAKAAEDPNAPRAGAPAPAPAGGAGPIPTDNYENPLLRSGLAFAGANKLESGEDDGILTAMEASGLDLEGTKLVVLSACETGVGKVSNGEGVYGLRRALVIAGAESLVMTLWQVDDIATRDLMAGYYKRLDAGKPRSSALRDIQLEIAARPKYQHPYYWASFVPAGDNTPLKD